MRELFRSRNYKLLFFGSLVSELGNVLFSFAAGLYVADLTGKASLLGLFMALGAGTRILLSPLAGVFVDRWNRVRIIYVTDYLRGVIFVATAVLFMSEPSAETATWVLLVVAVLSGTIASLFTPAVTAAIPEIVGLDQVQQATGANNIVFSMTQIFGIVLGMVAFGLFPFHIAVLINGISFLLSGFSEMFIRTPHKEEAPPAPQAGFFADFKGGLQYLVKRQGLLTLMIFSLFMNFAIAPLMSVGIPALFRIELGRSVWEIGWPSIAFSASAAVAGIVIGSMAIKRLAVAIRNGLALLVLSFVMMTLIIYLLDIGFLSYWVFYGLFIVANIGMAFFMVATNVPLNTGLIKVIEPNMRGRVFAAISALAGAATPVAVLLGGVVIDATNVTVLALICSVLLLIPAIGFVFNKKVKGLFDGIERDNNAMAEAAKLQA